MNKPPVLEFISENAANWLLDILLRVDGAKLTPDLFSATNSLFNLPLDIIVLLSFVFEVLSIILPASAKRAPIPLLMASVPLSSVKAVSPVTSIVLEPLVTL